MAILKVEFPQSLPLGTADYQAQNNQLIELIRNIGLVEPVSGSNIIQGAVLNVGGIVYMVDADTAISGTPSDYVKITPSVDTLTCTASYAANLTGVAWNKLYQGYYDGSGNLYLFDEVKAYNLSAISNIYSKFGLIKNLNISGNNTFHNIEILSSGSGNWVCPPGVTFIKILLMAGGGGGGGGYDHTVGAGTSGLAGGNSTFGALTSIGGNPGTGAPLLNTPGTGGLHGAASGNSESESGVNGSYPGGTAYSTNSGGHVYINTSLSKYGKGGNGGAGSYTGSVNAANGGGGGGGGVFYGYFNVTPGDTYSYSVGISGAAGNQGASPGISGIIIIEY